jgi:hypothetical protein
MVIHKTSGRWFAPLLVLWALLFAPVASWSATVVRADVDSILFLVPDDANLSDPRITVWLDAAKEEGLHLKSITDSQFVQLVAQDTAKNYLGLIMPDQVHVRASDAVVQAVKDYVAGGGDLMLVYDAGVHTADGFYAVPKSRFSDLVGIEYALYSQLGGSTIGSGNIVALQSSWRALRVPPGKSMLYPTATADADPVQGLTSYYYGFLNYPSFVTQGNYSGTAAIGSPNYGLVAGLNNYGDGGGRVMFVNTPLGYLKGYGTDGVLLHGFLHVFGKLMLEVPYLSGLPNGTPGMVINIHTDCGDSLADIATLNSKGFWNSGPYSIDFTAGPDCVAWGDKLGLNVPGNQTTRNWINSFISKGHEVGAHGGWIHDYFGLNVTESNQNSVVPGTSYTFNDLLRINKSAVEAVNSSRKVREYAAPEGNNPLWSTKWLEDNGVVAYYWVGGTGMAPTRGYRDGVLSTSKIWAHPLTPYGKAATFEEFYANGLGLPEATTWLTGLVDFAVQRRTSRMIYFHEPGITGSATDDGTSYLSAVQAMLNKGRDYGTSKFRFYTMARLSDFLSTRENTDWHVSLLSDGNLQVDATPKSPSTSLAERAWVFPKTRYDTPVPINSSVSVVNDRTTNEWVVVGKANGSARFTVKPLTPLF